MAVVRWPERDWLATDFQALLPSSNSSSWIEQANREVSSAYERQILLLVEGQDRAKVDQYLALVLQRLAASGYADMAFEAAQAQRWKSLSAALYPHRWGLLGASDEATLRRDPAAYFTQFQRLLYSPVGSRQLSMLESDPTGLFGGFMRSAAPNAVVGSDSYTQHRGHWEIAVLSIDPQRLGFDALGGLYSLYQSLREELRGEGLALHATGVPLYSAYGAHSAKREMSTIGVISVTLLIGLLLWALRSARAVALTLFCVLCGVGGGLAATVIALQQIHVLTMVFGATLIGIAADYALHYLAHTLLPGWTPATGLSRVYRGLLLGMLSSAIAFSALVFLPFPGIRQIGLFMASGLVCSFLTVCLVFPLAFRAHSSSGRLPAFCEWQPRVWRRSGVPFAGLVLVAIVGLFLLPGVDDVRDFYLAPQELTAAESELEQRLQSKPDSRYFLVQAPRMSELLENEERVMAQLRLLQDQGLVGSFAGITGLVPSPRKQAENNALLRDLGARGYFNQYLQDMGFNSAFSQAFKRELHGDYTPLGIDALKTLDLPLGVGGFLGCDGAGCASWIRLTSVHSNEALASIAVDNSNVRLVDPIDDVNQGIAKFRVAVGGMLVVAVLLTLGFLSSVCGWRQALRILALPVVSCLLCLAIIGLLKGAYTIVNLMALLLVMGVGLDYAIFRAFTSPAEQSATTLAIALSALTSILAFGMLSFSSTPVISSFGQTIGLGLFIAYCLSWLRLEGENSG